MRAFDAIESLCVHHDVSSFSVKRNVEYEHWLRIYWERSSYALGDRVLVATSGATVRGFLSSVDVNLDGPGGYQGSYVYMVAVAVDDDARGGPVFTGLAREGIASVSRLSEARGINYRGILATPGTDLPLVRALEAVGFRRISDTSAYWARLTED